MGQERVFFNVLQKKPLFSAFWSTTTLAKEKLVKSLKVQEDGKAQEKEISMIVKLLTEYCCWRPTLKGDCNEYYTASTYVSSAMPHKVLRWATQWHPLIWSKMSTFSFRQCKAWCEGFSKQGRFCDFFYVECHLYFMTSRILLLQQDVVGDRALLCPHHRHRHDPHLGWQGLEQSHPWWTP